MLVVPSYLAGIASANDINATSMSLPRHQRHIDVVGCGGGCGTGGDREVDRDREVGEDRSGRGKGTPGRDGGEGPERAGKGDAGA
jgi:iron only hydrogenase large subunit-like protein